MFGRTRFCLLAILSGAIAVNLTGQTERSTPAPNIVEAVPGLGPVHPVAGPGDVARLPFPPRFPVSPPGMPGFPQFVRTAGMIFSGTVKSIQRVPASRGEPVERVAVTFHIENAIRGATPGEDVVISQWMGLWSSGQRYRVGERLLLFFYPPSKLGLTSWVGGPLGRFVIDPGGRVLLTAQHLTAFRKDPVLGGRSRVRVSDFALAVRRTGEEE